MYWDYLGHIANWGARGAAISEVLHKAQTSDVGRDRIDTPPTETLRRSPSRPKMPTAMAALSSLRPYHLALLVFTTLPLDYSILYAGWTTKSGKFCVNSIRLARPLVRAPPFSLATRLHQLASRRNNRGSCNVNIPEA